MSFISGGFFIVVALSALIYYIIPKKYQWYVLLAFSLGFYATYGVKCFAYIGLTIFTTYCSTRIMAASTDKKIRKRWLIFALAANFGILFFLKYANFLILNIDSVINAFGGGKPISTVSLFLPLGISFYTFQTMSYVIDVYYKKYEPETNFLKLTLFTAFIPQLLQGPIGRYNRLAPQFFEGIDFDVKNIEYGAQRILWGLAKKLILADRATVIVNSIFNNLNVFSGVHIVVGILMYSIVIYGDFSGGIDVVIGVSEIFGIKLDENFRQPYFSKSIGEFWRRWHITLGTWMKDYIFYPMSISKKMFKFTKFAKKKFGKETGKIIPICITNIVIFFIVGVWHGAEWKYIIYGLYNGLIIAISNLCKPHYGKWASKCHINLHSKGWGFVQILRTFVLVNIGWFFDVCANAGECFYAMGRIFVEFNLGILSDGSLLKMGLNSRDWIIMAVALVVLFISSLMKEKGINLREFVAKRPMLLRWAIYLILIFCTAPFGFVGASTEFIYAQF